MPQITKGTWKIRALIKDKTQSKSIAAHVDLSAIYESKMKADIIGPMSTHLASFLVEGQSIILLDVQNKTVFKGQSSDKNVKNKILIPLNISQLYQVVFDHPIDGWKCKFGSDKLVSLCKSSEARSVVVWRNRRGNKKVVVIENLKAKVQLAFEYFSPEIEHPEETFSIPQPKSFKQKNI